MEMNTGIERVNKRGTDNEEYDYLKMMNLTDINYNKIKRGNRKQLSHNSNNPRQSVVNNTIQFLLTVLIFYF